MGTRRQRQRQEGFGIAGIDLPTAEVIAGLGLFLHYPWLRSLAMALLVIGRFFNARDEADNRAEFT